MKNNRLDAMLRRDENTAIGLVRDQDQYAGIEPDLAPLRTEHAANLAKAQALESAVLREDQDDSTDQKKSTRKQLIDLGGRLALVLQAHAASPTNPDADLAGRVRVTRTQLASAEEGSLVGLVAKLIEAAEPLAEPLARREFTAADLAELRRLLQRFETKQVQQRQSLVQGSATRATLEALLRRNASLVRAMRVQMQPYRGTAKNDVWLRFQGYSKVVVRTGGGGAANEEPSED